MITTSDNSKQPLLDKRSDPNILHNSPPPTIYTTYVEPYIQLSRLHKFPVGSLLVFWPAVWGLSMGAYRTSMEPTLFAKEVLAFLLGSTLLHSAACTINDICDRDFDRQVERTKNRPLVAGTASVPGATIWTVIQTVASICCLRLANDLAFQIGLIGVFPLHAFYPLMKRWTYWPQAWLGLAMNWGLPVAWLTVFGSWYEMDIPFVFFFGTFCWTIVYDTIYACQDRRDDVKAGVKSTALLFGTWIKPILSLFASAFVLTMVYAGVRNGQGPAYFVVTTGGCSLHLLWQLYTLDVDTPSDCWSKFVANHYMGYIAWGGILIDFAIKLSSSR